MDTKSIGDEFVTEYKDWKNMEPNCSMPQALDEHQTSRVVLRAVQSLRNDRHMRRGIPYCKIGRSVRYLLSDIQAYLEKNRVDPESN